MVTIAGRSLVAVLFDLDGVVTDTSAVHCQAWKVLFDEYLFHHAESVGSAFIPFDADSDYRRHVDGRLRNDGVRDFLASRSIDLADGSPDDTEETTTISGLAKRKDHYFHLYLTQHGAPIYPSTIALVTKLLSNDVKTAIVSSSRHASSVLAAAGIEELFQVKVTGVEAEALHLKGKPEPDMYLRAAKQLGVPPLRAAVVEDAIAGVKAGRRGNFGLVVGVDRDGHGNELRQAGADVVVEDLSLLSLDVREATGGVIGN